MNAYQHILVTTDFSKFSEVVAKKAVNIAGHYNSKITLLHVVEDGLDGIAVDLVTSKDRDQTLSILDKNRRWLDEFSQAIPYLKAIPMVILLKKTVEDEIIKVAKKIKADLIVIGANGTSDESSVSVQPGINVNTIKEQSPCDVLVVHLEEN